MQNSISQKFQMRSLLAFTLPSMVMMLFVAIYSMFGSIFASKYIGENAMSAINIVFPLISAVLAVAIMFATGSNAIIASDLGKGECDKARQKFTNIFVIGTVVGIILSFVSIIFKTPIVQMLGATNALQPLCEEYLVFHSISFPFIFWQVYAQYFFVTVSKPLYGMVAVLVGGSLNLTVAYLSMAIWKWGVIGAAIAAGISFFVPGFVYVLYFLMNKKDTLYFVKPKRHKGLMFNTCFNGSSEMVTNLAISIVTLILNIIMKELKGNDGIAAVSVIVQIQFLLSSLYIGFGGGVAPIFAYAKGEGNYNQIKNVFKLSIYFATVSSVILVACCILFVDNIVGMFIHADSTAYQLTKTGLLIFSSSYLFAGTNIFSSVFFTSLSNGKISATISFLRTFAFILGMLLVLPKILGVEGVWLATPVAEFLTLFIVLLLFKKYKKIYHY